MLAFDISNLVNKTVCFPPLFLRFELCAVIARIKVVHGPSELLQELKLLLICNYLSNTFNTPGIHSFFPI